jgi:hypothetical protein
MKLQHYIGGLEGLPEPLTLDRRVRTGKPGKGGGER